MSGLPTQTTVSENFSSTRLIRSSLLLKDPLSLEQTDIKRIVNLSLPSIPEHSQYVLERVDVDQHGETQEGLSHPYKVELFPCYDPPLLTKLFKP